MHSPYAHVMWADCVKSLTVKVNGPPISGHLVSYKCTKKQLHKLKGEVGMAVPKSTQTRVVGIITCVVRPYTCFFSLWCNVMYTQYY